MFPCHAAPWCTPKAVVTFPDTGATVVTMTRRGFLSASAAAVLPAQAGLTEFQVGCMTIVYSPYPFSRALAGIRDAGYRYVGWGTTHEKAPVIAPDAPPAQAKELGAVCRGLGLEPSMMFSMIYVEAPDSVKVHTRRIEQAAAAGIPYIITFGRVQPGAYEVWIKNLKQLGPVARSNGVVLTIKQHGGNTATGRDCAKIIADVADEGVKMCYDAGNVLDYENHDPIPDIQACWSEVRSFAIKDHRNTPRDQDCGPGFGEIDHYKLLLPVARTGLKMPLCCENIFAPVIPRPNSPDGVDALARRAREFLEVVVKGVQAG
jgi:sugar phosphate isomerase/epimerase